MLQSRHLNLTAKALHPSWKASTDDLFARKTHLSVSFKQSNPRFDAERFRLAVETGDTSRKRNPRR